MMRSGDLEILGTVWGQGHTVVLDRASAVLLSGKRLVNCDGQVLAERAPDTWQSARGWHSRIQIHGEVALRFESPAYQYQSEERHQQLQIVGGTVWSGTRELIAFYDAAHDRWRDSDNQIWKAIGFNVVEPSACAELPPPAEHTAPACSTILDAGVQ